MAIIVDKVQKRRDIALACKDLVVARGIKNITISQIAKTAGVGKGTIYDYFKNKEHIVFELVNTLIQERNVILSKRMETIQNTKDKIKLFIQFFYCDEDAQLRQIYKEFISIALSSPDEEMIAFQTECFDGYYHWFETMIHDAIESGEIIASSKELCKGLFVTAEGMFIASSATNSIGDVEHELNSYIDAVFKLLEVKQ